MVFFLFFVGLILLFLVSIFFFVYFELYNVGLVIYGMMLGGVFVLILVILMV